MTDDKLKLPRSSYEELCKIIKAYGRHSKAASLEEVNALAGVGTTVISANNAFLSFAGLIDGGKAKMPTTKGAELAMALEHEIPDQIESSWAKVVCENDFLSKMALAVKIRKSMEVTALESHIAYSAGEAKSGQVMTGARAVIDILRASGTIKEKDGQLITGMVEDNLSLNTSTGRAQSEPQEQRAEGVPTIPVTRVDVASGVSLHIELNIDAKPSELDGLGKKIKTLIEELQQGGNTTIGAPAANG